MRYEWPDGNQCAVVLSFDVDAESGHVFREPHEAATRLDVMEERRFGPRVGVPRILRLLEKYGLPASFFVPGYTIVHHTDVIKTIRAAGHEMGCHGNVHEAVHMLSPEDERRVLGEQLDIYEQHLGIRPKGYRSPSWSVTVHTPRLLKEFGFTYDSSLMGDDIPYWIDTPHGRLAELPIQWQLDDAPFYRHVYGLSNQMTNPMHLVDQWLQEFRGMYRENGAFILTMHPYISGRASRIDALEWLIRQIRQEPNVWWATCMQVAEWAIQTGQNAETGVRFPDE
jgi:peptidoglycan/xylan/chitin deacetylase (PgdA/CDA1 family)